MSLITSQSTLNAAVAEWLNRTDISGSNVGIDLMIQQAEARLRNDRRVRHLATATFSITAAANDLAAPAGFKHLESWYHDGTTYYKPIEIVPLERLARLKELYGATGVPLFAAVTNATFRFAPVPDATYSTKMAYWETLTALSAGSNWLVASHPHIYLYATLCESAAYLVEDERLPMWEMKLDALLNDLAGKTQDDQFSGPLRRTITPIG